MNVARRVGLDALMVIVALNVWTGSPLLALWIGSRVQQGGPPSMLAVGVTVVALAVLSILLLRVLTLLGSAHDRLVGAVPTVRTHAPWLRSMRGERERYAGEDPRVPMAERVAVLMVVAAFVVFEIWFFFFSSSPIDQRSGRSALPAEPAGGVYFGGIRRAPSSRIVSPLSMVFSAIDATSAAYSEGLPSRCGKGTPSPRALRASSGSAASSGVSNRPGAMVFTRTPRPARSRAAGRVMPTTPPLEAEYDSWPIWPSKAAIDAVMTTAPRSPSSPASDWAMAFAPRRSRLNMPIRLTWMTFS